MKIPRTVIQALGECGLVKENEMLKKYTTYRTGGPADAVVFPRDNGAISAVMKIVRAEGIPVTVIGAGSNLLAGDRGIEGIVVRLCENDVRKGEILIGENDEIYADSIATKERFLQVALQAGFSGMEFMAGIPGCIGGGIMMNAGTTHGAFADILRNIDIVAPDGQARQVAVDRGMFSYRHVDIQGGAVITGARFSLPRTGDSARVRKNIEDILADRKKKHPLDYPSAGSVFKNPRGHSSWKLINDAGLKGKRIGGACISDLHTNFIINVDNATSRDIRDLIELTRQTVSRKFGVELETEIKMIGMF